MRSKFDLHELKVLECIFVERNNRETHVEEHFIFNYLEKLGFENPRLVVRHALLNLKEKKYLVEEFSFHGEPSYLLTDSGERLFLDYPMLLSSNFNINNLLTTDSTGG